MIRAILHAQWLSLRNARLGARRLGGVVAIIATLVWYAVWTALGIGAFAFASHPDTVGTLTGALPRGLMFVVLYWQLAPLLTGTMGASLDIRKIRLYPVSERQLFGIDVFLRLTTSLEMLLVLGGLIAGMTCNPKLGGALQLPARLLALLVFTGFNLLVAAGLRSLLERLLARKLVREIAVLLIVCLTVLPQLLMITGLPLERVREIAFAHPLPLWPWSAAAGLLLPGFHWWHWAILGAWTAAAWKFGSWQFGRSLRHDLAATETVHAGLRFRPMGLADRLWRLPASLLPDPMAAVVEKEMRSLGRTPRFRTLFIMGFSFGLVVWFPLAFQRVGESTLANEFLSVVSIYALTLLGQVTYWNAFGFDRSAAQAYFIWPVGFRSVLAGKNLATTYFILLEMIAVTLASLVLRVPLSASKIAEAYLVTLVIALYVLAAGNLTSVRMPRALAPDRTMQSGTGGRLHGLLFFAYPIALLPVATAYLARYAFASQLAFWVVLGFAAALGILVYWIAMDSAVDSVHRRREQFLSELSEGGGPLASD